MPSYDSDRVDVPLSARFRPELGSWRPRRGLMATNLARRTSGALTLHYLQACWAKAAAGNRRGAASAPLRQPLPGPATPSPLPDSPLPESRLPCYHSVALSGHSVGAWRSLVARIVRDDEVGGSNPLAPTIPITSCVGNNPAFISAWPISQAFSFG